MTEPTDDELRELEDAAAEAEPDVLRENQTGRRALYNRGKAEAAAQLDAITAERDELRNANETKSGFLHELYEQIAQMCERFGDKRTEVPCDSWRLRDNILKTERELSRCNDRLESLRRILVKCDWVIGLKHDPDEEDRKLLTELRAALEKA